MMSCAAYAQQAYTGSNICLLQISTDSKNYQFITRNLYARINDPLDRFEFTIPVYSVQSQGDSTDVVFLKTFAGGNDAIVIHALLPGDQESELDLSYFKGNKALDLASEISIGKFTFENDIQFNGLLMGGDQEMAFDFTLFLNESTSAIEVGNEHVIEIKLAARGDKMIGLTNN
jgi:hypothetical protein